MMLVVFAAFVDAPPRSTTTTMEKKNTMPTSSSYGFRVPSHTDDARVNIDGWIWVSTSILSITKLYEFSLFTHIQ